MTKSIQAWHRDRFDKLERRLDHHRRLAQSLVGCPTLAQMNAQAMLNIESRLLRLGERPGVALCAAEA